MHPGKTSIQFSKRRWKFKKKKKKTSKNKSAILQSTNLDSQKQTFGETSRQTTSPNMHDHKTGLSSDPTDTLDQDE